MKISKPIKLILRDNKEKRNKKYSNITLFSRRENERKLSLSIRNNTKSNFSTFNKYKNSLPFISITNSSSNKKINNQTFSKKISYDNNTLYNTTHNSTERNLDNSISFFEEYEPKKKKKFNYNIKLLSKFEDEEINLRKKQNKTDLDIKNKTLNLRKGFIRNYINETRESKLLNYTINSKRERLRRLNENYDMIYLKEITDSLNNSSRLFNEQFVIKFGEYVKKLFIRKENEKEKKDELLKEILNLRTEISVIESKIQKQQMDKNNLLKWIYFQISVKEKKLNLPNYYKILLEGNDYSFINYFDFNNNLKRRESQMDELKKVFIRNIYFKKPETKKTIKRLNTKNPFQTFTLKDNNKNIPKKEIERIQNYRFNRVFYSPDDLIDMLKKYENINIQKINLYNELRIQIRELEKEKNEIELQKKEQLKNDNLLIQTKENILKRLQEKNKQLNKEKIQYFKIINKNESKKRKKILEIKSIHSKLKLEDSIQKLFKTCQLISLDKIINPDLFLNNRKLKSKEEELLEILTKIEIVICFLKNQFSIYKNINGEYYTTYKKIMLRVEKEHKINNSNQLKEQYLLKLKKLKEDLERKNTKIYFTQLRKTNNYLKYAKNKKGNQSNNEYIFKEIEFEDFMFDIQEEKKSKSNEQKKKKVKFIFK